MHFGAAYSALYALLLVGSEGALQPLATPDVICHRTSLLRGPPDMSAANYSQIVVVGDIHGALNNLLTVLHAADIVASPGKCEWSTTARSVLLVQTGDVVDRGPQATEAWACLQRLQRQAGVSGSRVVRLVGNHELLWLQDDTGYRNLKHDTDEKVSMLQESMRQDIQAGTLQASFYVEAFMGIPLFFSHAGLRPQMLHQLTARSPTRSPEPLALSAFVNDKLRLDVSHCLHRVCLFKDAIYSVGAERGGREIGGIFWTDYAVLEKAAIASRGGNERGGTGDSALPSLSSPWAVVQIVGHTLSLGRVRAARGLHSICVDVGLYLGGQGWLEIAPSGHFLAHEYSTRSGEGWQVRDLTVEMCQAR